MPFDHAIGIFVEVNRLSAGDIYQATVHAGVLDIEAVGNHAIVGAGHTLELFAEIHCGVDGESGFVHRQLQRVFADERDGRLIVNNVDAQRACGEVAVLVRHLDTEVVRRRGVLVGVIRQRVAVFHRAFAANRVIGEGVDGQRTVVASNRGLARAGDFYAANRDGIQPVDRGERQFATRGLAGRGCVSAGRFAITRRQARFVNGGRRHIQHILRVSDFDIQISRRRITIRVGKRVVEGVRYTARGVRVARVGVAAVRLNFQFAVLALYGQYAAVVGCVIGRYAGAGDAGNVAGGIGTLCVFACTRVVCADATDDIAQLGDEARYGVAIAVRLRQVIDDADGQCGFRGLAAIPIGYNNREVVSSVVAWGVVSEGVLVLDHTIGRIVFGDFQRAVYAGYSLACTSYNHGLVCIRVYAQGYALHAIRRGEGDGACGGFRCAFGVAAARQCGFIHFRRRND